MRHVAAYLLGALSGKEPTSSDIERILSSVGVEVDSKKLEKVISELKGKNIEELIAKGRTKLAAMPVGGGGGAAVVAAVPAVAEAAAPAVAESKKEEKKKEESESEDDDMGFGLFD